MGVYTIAGRNLMLNALAGTNPPTPITHVGLLEAGTPITGVVGEADNETLTKVGHGLANGDLVVLSSLSGGAGLVAGRPYFVVGVSGNDFQLSHTSGGSAVAFSTDVTDVTVTELVELSGGSPAYARATIAFSAAANGTIDDSTDGADLNVPAGRDVDYIGFYSASSAGTLLAIDDVTSESFAAQGTYTVTDADLDLLAAGGA